MRNSDCSVLVVDDDQQVLSLVTLSLEYGGFHVGRANSGHEALEKLTLGPTHLIILDLMMPGMSGLEFAKKYRESFDDFIPILILSAIDTDLSTFAKEISAQGWMSKPFTPASLLEETERLINIYHNEQPQL